MATVNKIVLSTSAYRAALHFVDGAYTRDMQFGETSGVPGYSRYYASVFYPEFNYRYGSSASSSSATFGNIFPSSISGLSISSLLPVPSGYTFVGWYTYSGFSSYVKDDSNLVLLSTSTSLSTAAALNAGGVVETSGGNTTYYRMIVAVFRLPTFVVTFDANGGSVSPASATTDTNGYVTLPTPKRTGHAFSGWYTSASGGTKIGDAGGKYKPSSNITVYAHWTANTYTITYNLNGGTNPSGAPTTYTYGVGATLPTPTRTNYNFAGWYEDSSFSGEALYAVPTTAIGNKVFYARWILTNDYVVFDPNGGESVSTSYVRVYVGSQIGTLPTATWGDQEYSFVGWFTERDGGTQIVSTTIVTDEMPRRLFAHWRDNKVTVTFDASGGLAPVSYLLVAGVSYGELPTAYKYGYSFEGWYSSSSLTDRVVSTSIVPAFDHTLYAKFEQSSGETYSIVFRDDVSGQTATVEAPVGQNFILPDVSSGLGFVVPSGYAMDPSRSWICMNTGAVYADRALVKDLVPSGETVVLTWVLVKNTVTITLDPNGGTLETTTYQKLVGDQYGTFPEPSRDGYNFDGWFTAATGGTKIEATATVSADATYYAHWSEAAVDWWKIETW